jgi:hypothetical protein
MNTLPIIILSATLSGDPMVAIPQAAFFKEAVYWEDENFLENALGFAPNSVTFSQHYGAWFEETKEAVDNFYSPNVVDTVYHFTQYADTVQFYKTENGEYLAQAILRTPVVNLKGGIHVGMSKEEFGAILGKKCPVPDLLQIGDHAHNEVYYFYFVNDRLQTIFFDGYVD